MKATDLRIGNLIYFPNAEIQEIGIRIPSFISTIKEIHDITVIREVDNLRIEELISDCSPIPLTEDWLVKFGSKKYQAHSDLIISYFIGPYDINLLPDGKWEFVVNNNYVLAYIEHVHELQNLYYCLTGKELILKS